MGEIVSIHPENPQQRLLDPVVDVIRRGGVVAYPTDSVYALGCHIGDKQAMDRIRAIRCLDKHHNFQQGNMNGCWKRELGNSLNLM